MQEVPIERLRQAIRDLHSCASSFLESVPVLEAFAGETVWEGLVQVFRLYGHPDAHRCYAWSYETDSGGRKFVAVLHKGRINSPQTAVQTAIIDELR